jgi:hypothetical protein
MNKTNKFGKDIHVTFVALSKSAKFIGSSIDEARAVKNDPSIVLYCKLSLVGHALHTWY